MRLVDGDGPDGHAVQPAEEGFRMQPFRTDVEELQGAHSCVFQGPLHVPLAALGRDGVAPDSFPFEALDLVFHQGDQRAHHDGGAFGG